MSRYMTLIISSTTILGAALLAFTAFALVFKPPISAQEHGSNSPSVTEAVPAESVEAAGQMVGYTVKEPSVIPDGFKRGPILVTIPEHGGRTGLSTVLQSWGSPEGDAAFRIIQSRASGGLGEGESILLAGVEGRRVFLPGASFDAVVYYWQKAGVSFTLVGKLDGVLTEDRLREIVDSI